MKIVIIHGQNHKGSTYLIARELAEKIGGEIEEFFLPRDFDKPCAGCWTCFRTDLTQCPHYEKLRPIVEAIDAADVLILASPVYVYHATGQMMAFLDHFGTRWLVHRPEPAYFRKQAVVISTATGGGMKSTCKDMADSLFFWGVPRIYRLGLAVRASKPSQITPKTMEHIHKKTDRLAEKIRNTKRPIAPTLKTRLWFAGVRFAHIHFKRSEPDYTYWEERGWHGKRRPWK